MAEPLAAGNVRTQLMTAFEDQGHVDDLMRRLHLPEWLGQPAYLQIPLSAELWNDYMTTRHLNAGDRQRRLVNRIVEAFQRRSA